MSFRYRHAIAVKHAGFRLGLHHRPAALEKTNNHNDQSHHQQDVDQSSGRVRGEHSKQPQNNQYDDKSPEHIEAPFIFPALFIANARKKADVAERPEAFDHVGLLVNGSSGGWPDYPPFSRPIAPDFRRRDPRRRRDCRNIR
jgi:hypothetical protein